MIHKGHYNYKKIGDYLALAIVFIFLSKTFFRLYPFTEITPGISNGNYDWFRYWDNAIDIHRNGFWISSQTKVYYGPGSILYNYFVAGCFLLFGENVVPIYFIQSLLLAFSILLIYNTFRKNLSGLSSILLLLTLFAFAVLDVYKYYTFKLLSENVAIFTIAVFVYFAKKGFDNFKIHAHYLAVIFLMFSVLLRPTIFPLAFLYVCFLLVYFYQNPQLKKLHFIGLISLLFIGLNFLALRNYLIVGIWTFLPSEGISDSWKQLLALDYTTVYKKILFALGFLSQLNPAYYPRPHWFLLWFLYGFYCIYQLKNRKSLTYSVFLFNALIIGFYVLNILFVTVDSYGFRAFLPFQFLFIGIAFLSVDKLFSLFKREEKL
jgi:hypothetical protein